MTLRKAPKRPLTVRIRQRAEMVKEKIPVPVRTVAVKTGSGASRVIRAGVSAYASHQASERERLRRAQNIRYVERKTAQSAYVRGRQKGIEQAAYRAGREKGEKIVKAGPPRPTSYSVGGYSLSSEIGGMSGGESELLGFLRPTPAPKKKAARGSSEFMDLVGI